ncbi:hypothetical protein [Prevotella sp. 10(H)]|uniref:hypothetical protein n=1 Tax=Prevotella sp. 10(H) TaxID=1158294 RepID=UPI0004A6FE84|nr:hypothetical protein [Prevotella sp. 10(H)]
MEKIKYIVITVFLLFIFSSCGKEEEKNVIPAERVNFRINLKIDNELRAPGGYKEYVRGKHPLLEGEALGFGGLLVINSFYATNTPDLLAYDLSCPSEALRTVLVSATSDGKAKCSKCGRIYNLMENGRVVSESSDLHLQRYIVAPTSNPDIFYITRQN